MKRIRAKVANVISESSVALNVGSNSGVKENLTVRIMRTVKVEDPDTKEELGQVLVTKLNLRVSLVQDKLCVARVTDTQDMPLEDAIRSITRIRKKKTIVSSAFDEELGKSVHVSVGDNAVVDVPEEDAPS